MATAKMKHTQTQSLLENLLQLFTNGQSKEDELELKRYDNIRFDDVNKEISEAANEKKRLELEKK